MAYFILFHLMNCLRQPTGGVTWEFVGPCPKGYTRELMITEDAFYLCLGQGIFRSDDAGNSWEAMNDGLDSRLAEYSGVHSLRVNQDMLFVMTDIGLYRLDKGSWKYLQAAGGLTLCMSVLSRCVRTKFMLRHQ